MRNSTGVVLHHRLLAVINMIDSAHTVADIGCDHGRLAVSLYQMGIAEHVIASDISEASLDKARFLVQKCGLDGVVELVLSDGLSHLKPHDADVIVIAGMGGELIASILAANEDTARSADSLILQPMSGFEELRQYLYNNNYNIFNEALAFDTNRYYQVIGTRSGTPSPIFADFPDNYWGLGCKLFENQDPLLPEMLEKKRNTLRKQLYSARMKGNEPEYLLSELDLTSQLFSLLPKYYDHENN